MSNHIVLKFLFLLKYKSDKNNKLGKLCMVCLFHGIILLMQPNFNKKQPKNGVMQPVENSKIGVKGGKL